MQPAKRNVQAAVNTATSQDGREIISTVKVINKMEGDKELTITFENTTQADITYLAILLPAYEAGKALPTGVNFTSDGFATYGEMQAYFDHIKTNVVGFRAETDNTANFAGNLVFTEKEPDGNVEQIKKSLTKWRQPLGGGTYSNELEASGEDITFMIWPAMGINLSTLKASSRITFILNVRGWNKSADMSNLRESRL